METAKPTVLIRMPMVMAYPTLKMTRRVGRVNPDNPSTTKDPAPAGFFFWLLGV